MTTINIYSENELHRFAVSEKEIHLTHMACNDEEELTIRRQDLDVSTLSIHELDTLYKRTLIQSLGLPLNTVSRPIKKDHSILLEMTDGSQYILFYTAVTDQASRAAMEKLHNIILYRTQIPRSPANPDAVAPLRAADKKDPDPTSITAAAAATSPRRPMTPTSESLTSVSV
jgi:hypothetical protein